MSHEIKIQFNRLKRHYDSCQRLHDEISFLDLAHSLRIWVDLKSEVDKLLSTQKVCFDNPQNNKALLKSNNGSEYVYINSVNTSDKSPVKIMGYYVKQKASSEDEIRERYQKGPPQTKPTKLSYSEWIGSNIIEMNVSISDGQTKRVQIQRQILIKRVANLFGGSHPLVEQDSLEDRKFDSQITNLHLNHSQNNIPLTYLLLLEISGQIIEKLSTTVERQSLN